MTTKPVDQDEIQEGLRLVRTNKPVNAPLLTEELFEAFPEWIVGDKTSATISQDGNTTRIIFPATTAPGEVQAVVNSHNRGDKSKAEKEKDKRKETKGAYDGLPSWISNSMPSQASDYVVLSTVGDESLKKLVKTIDDAASVEELKPVLRTMATAIFGLVDITSTLAQAAVIVVRFLKGRL